MRFVSIISLLAIAGGVAKAGTVHKYCAFCYTDGESSLVLEDECALPDGGVKCRYSIKGYEPLKYIHCTYDNEGKPHKKDQPKTCFAKAYSLEDTCTLDLCTKH